MNKKFLFINHLCFICFLISLSIQLNGQADPSSSVLEIGAISVSGAKFSDPNAIRTISGLKAGEKIQIPGPKINKAIRGLMNLKLFSNVEIIREKMIGDIIFLEIHVTERPRLLGWSYTGIKKSYHEDLNKEVAPFLLKGGIVTENNKLNSINAIKKFFRSKGYLDATAVARELDYDSTTNQARLVFDIKRNSKVKIQDITFSGNSGNKGSIFSKNDNLSDRKLRKQMKDTHVTKRIKKRSSNITMHWVTEMLPLFPIQYGERKMGMSLSI